MLYMYLVNNNFEVLVLTNIYILGNPNVTLCLQATIVRNAKDTAHTKAERSILESVKVRGHSQRLNTASCL